MSGSAAYGGLLSGVEGHAVAGSASAAAAAPSSSSSSSSAAFAAGASSSSARSGAASASSSSRSVEPIAPAKRVTIVGSGNWGSAVARMIGANCSRLREFDDEVRMWVFEETLEDGRKLSDVINETNENVKYLPGIKLPANVVAVPDLGAAVQDADVLVFVIPHQFLSRTCEGIRGRTAPGCVAISLIKGLDVTPDGPRLLSELITESLGEMPCSVLMGANVADDVALEHPAEATIGALHPEDGATFRNLFTTTYFRVKDVRDVAGVETAGALKNIVALAAGFADGMGVGGNTKAAVIRLGMLEMIAFTKMFFPDTQTKTYFESCGFADLLVTCFHGRNRKTAEAFVREKKPFEQLEKEMLNGQKLQGTLTAEEVFVVLKKRGVVPKFPLFATTYRIAFEGTEPKRLLEVLWDPHASL